MAKTNNNKKSKPAKQHGKKYGKQAEIEEMRVQLDALGLKIVEVTADGNCFFRAVADQLEGNQEKHGKYRKMVLQYIMDHRHDFEPFIEDEVPFDEYCQSMEKDGTWAGNLELQAASLVTRSNICIHLLRSPRWYISNFSNGQVDMMHLSYHDGEHYNSVRLKEDSCEGAARPIIIKVDASISAKDVNKKSTTNRILEGSSGRCTYDEVSVKIVISGTGCKSIEKVKQVLEEVDGNIDAAIEFLIAEQELDESDLSSMHPCENGNGDNLAQSYTKSVLTSKDIETVEDAGDGQDHTVQGNNLSNQDKMLLHNKESSSRLKKKGQAASSTASEKSASPVVRSKFVTSKSKKEIKKG